jgi:PaaX-like protein
MVAAEASERPKWRTLPSWTSSPTAPATSSIGPVVSRRREIGGASARSLLMTLLGEFVLPRGGSVWTQALTSALGLFGVEDKSARQALARTAAEGWLAPERAGRQVRWSLTPPGQRLLSEGARRIYSFGRDEVQWDGRWLVLLVSVPESQRDRRHRIRAQLKRCARRPGWCTSGAASRSWTPACPPGCCRRTGAGPRPPACSTPGTPPGIRPPSATGTT